jgi:thiol:disulfide interchange protein DsbD
MIAQIIIAQITRRRRGAASGLAAVAGRVSTVSVGTVSLGLVLMGAVSAGSLLAAAVVAQSAPSRVHWQAALVEPVALGPGVAASIAVSAQIDAGWHVYALTQAPGGPTALQIAVDENPVVEPGGAPVGPNPETRHDPSFDLDTQYYLRGAEFQVPVVFRRTPDAGRQWIPISVRFQSCSDRECLPPTTVHLRVAIDVNGNS